MTEIEPTIENVREGDTVTIERGAPGEPGHASLTYLIASSSDKAVWSHEVTVSRVQKLTESDMGYRITRITRPAPQIPSEQGERFWARWKSESPREYIGTIGDRFVDLTDGAMWERDLFERCHTVVPAPEPEAVKYEKETSND